MNFPCGATDTSQMETYECLWCGKEIENPGPRQKWCSASCKQKAYRARHKVVITLAAPEEKRFSWWDKLRDWVTKNEPFEP